MSISSTKFVRRCGSLDPGWFQRGCAFYYSDFLVKDMQFSFFKSPLITSVPHVRNTRTTGEPLPKHCHTTMCHTCHSRWQADSLGFSSTLKIRKKIVICFSLEKNRMFHRFTHYLNGMCEQSEPFIKRNVHNEQLGQQRD